MQGNSPYGFWVGTLCFSILEIRERPMASDSAAESKAFDFAELVERTAGDESLARELLEKFFGEYPGFIQEMRDLTAEENWEELRLRAHRFKGITANLSLHESSGALSEIQEEAGAMDGEMLCARFDRLSRLLAQAEGDFGIAQSDSLTVVLDSKRCYFAHKLLKR